jgi:hypothetical protein
MAEDQEIKEVLAVKTIALYMFGFIRFWVLIVSIISSFWFFTVTVFGLIVAIGDWNYVFTQHLKMKA